MSFLFKSKHKSPHDLVKQSKELALKLDDKKNAEALSANIDQMKIILVGDHENEPSPELVAQLSQEIYNTDLLVSLVQNLDKMEFEAKKDFGQVFSSLLRRQIGTRHPTVEYLASKEYLIVDLVKSYEKAETALSCGIILRECFKYEALTKIVLSSDVLYCFFAYVEVNSFDISTDAFLTFKELLTKHKALSAEFLTNNYDKFFTKYTTLIHSSNYVTKRQSIKLLGEILLERSNFKVMTKYIGDPENLKLIMNLLKDKARNIQFEAFHVFKVFVANPQKSDPVKEILTINKQRLLTFLQSFQNEKQDDEQFVEEKQILIKVISDL